MDMIDGYSHIGLPRFQSVESALGNMDANGIDAAIVCPFEAGPDLVEVHRSLTVAPDRFSAFGLALGDEKGLIERGMHAQFDAGFDGFRLQVERITEAPSVLDVIGERGGIAMPVGGEGLSSEARRLLDFLERYPDALVVATHLAGPTTPDIFERDGVVKALFSHPRFSVVLTRQARLGDGLVGVWIEALIEIVGRDRLMWGSETPVLFWREDSVKAAGDWFRQFTPTPADEAMLYGEAARRVVFSRPRRPVAPLRLPYDPFTFELRRPAPMWPQGFAADTRVPAKLVEAWQRQGGAATMSLSAFASRLLLDALERDSK